MFKNIIRVLGGDPNKRVLKSLIETVVNPVNALEEEYEKLSDQELTEKTPWFRQRLAGGETLDELMIEAFAAVREASKRTLGKRHFDVQLIGGAALHQGMIAEMRTGEGKTLAATLPLYLNALENLGVHLVTVNDYLARRDARWMAPIFALLGMRVGVLQMAARTDGAKKAFLVDLEHTSQHEDRHQLLMVSRKEAYDADITYGTNSEFGFDYLRDNQAIRWEDRVQRGHRYAIIDEVDNILIDEARTPLIISGPASDETEWFVRMAQIVERLRPEDYEVSEKDRSVSLTEVGEAHVEELLDTPLGDADRPEDVTPEQARLLGYLEQALRARHLFKRNKDYLIQSGRVIIIDPSTGRMMPGRRWSEGLHQAIEAHENVHVNPENITYATITLQNYYRMYHKLSGMTGTALTEAEEFFKIYKLDVLPIPTNLEYIVSLPESTLEQVKARDDQGYEHFFYSKKADPLEQPVYWKRKDFIDVVFRTTEAKLRAIVQEILKFHVTGRPQLVGTTSVENSEILSRRLQMKEVRILLQVLLLRQLWMEHSGEEFVKRSNPTLNVLNTKLDEMNLGTLRNAARDLGLTFSLNLEEKENINRLMHIFGLDAEHHERLLAVIKGGVPHLVLNARKHDEESKMIERAGSFGAVTIATNMAGRGVDIKLGGNLPEQVTSDVVHVLENLGYDPYAMSLEERYNLLESIPEGEISVVRAGSVKDFIEYMQNMQRVKALGGLHVIGSERYEARRIDNQLRGRSARQGDPGSSRYYLSLEDDLMRLFGGQQVESLWGRVFIDDSLPIEMKMLGRIVEQSQERVEGANFDTRKHVLEYDDVLNEQRKRIYSQRDRAFSKEDLSDDVLDMLRGELEGRVAAGLKDEEGPWRLMAFLEQVQPSFEYEGISFPSFPSQILLDEIHRKMQGQEPTPENLRHVLLDIASQALQARFDHLARVVRKQIESSETSFKASQEERYETLDAFVSSLQDEDAEENEGRKPSAGELIARLSEDVRIPIRLTGEEARRMLDADEEVIEAIRHQIDSALMAIILKRVIGSLERRMGEELNLSIPELQSFSWDVISERIMDTLDQLLTSYSERLLGENGQIGSDLTLVLGRISNNLMDERNLVGMLIMMTQGSRLVFDRKTHLKRTHRYNRLSYTDLVARLMEGVSNQEATTRILDHLVEALHRLELLRGKLEWNRLVHNEINLAQLDQRLREMLIENWSLEAYEERAALPLSALPEDDQEDVRRLLGRRLHNDACREILVRVISSQWVEYLTQIEGLRVSIGMEAYAQRDPLVQYKLKASEMFQELLGEIRMGVINRLFTYQPRRETGLVAERERAGVESQTVQPSETGREQEKREKKKRKRH